MTFILNTLYPIITEDLKDLEDVAEKCEKKILGKIGCFALSLQCRQYQEYGAPLY